MAKIVQSLTRAAPEYTQRNLQSLVRDLDGVITKLNTSFQEEVKQEIEACLLYTSPSPRDGLLSRMPSSA